MRIRTRTLLFIALAALAASTSCKKNKTASPTPSASGSSAPAPFPVASGIPMPPIEIGKIVNSGGLTPYSGPSGSIRGLITATGDPAPVLDEIVDKIPADCELAKEAHAKLFREGMMRSLADVLVTVTGYHGYIPAKANAQQLEAKGCAWSRRTVALTFGQRLDIANKDKRPYVPDLMGAGMKAQLVAVPGGEPVQLYPMRVGRYVLVDSMRLFMAADVLVLKYPTHAVTGLDGRYEIKDIPAGKVTLTAFLPSTGERVEKHVEVAAGKAIDVDLQLKFDAKSFSDRTKKADTDAAVGGAGAGGSGSRDAGK